ncbi:MULTISPECIES: diguanylate cyclase [unclassified Undibacterium]|uniref:tetratricopeptide repeat-containing diguanylate cyclase n=1 Tax=unclassified Undibacterium TaxID=2630295 RepID=UPI002AC97760|nr:MULTISPECIES: diguanylate cyclase [unclassified Undibacterium]WPX45267.1 diguanylate cyclase [Undibacterium sp. CCC3.4]
MLNKKFSFVPALCLLFLLNLAVLSQTVRADEQAEIAYIATMMSLADTDNAEALKRLDAYQRKHAGASARLRLELLKALASVYFDAGNMSAGAPVLQELASLAEREHDEDGRNLAQIMASYQAIDGSEPDKGLKQLHQILANLSAKASPEVRMYLHSALGRAYYVMGNFDLALKYYLQALSLTDTLPYHQVESRLRRLDAIAKLYTSMKDPEKALATVEEAFEISPLARTPKILASLSISQGIAYTDLHRNKEAIAAYQRALKISREAGMASLEVMSLLNISDYYLVLADYKNAELYARKSLPKAETIGDSHMIAVAKANLGFALAGQGKVEQGVELINAVVQAFLAADLKTDAESLLGELAGTYEKAGMYREALARLRQQQALSDELFRADRSKAVASLQESFNAEQRQKQIQLLAKENALKDADIRNHRLQQLVALLAAALMVLVACCGFLLYRRVQRINKQLREANTQLEFHAIRDPLTGLHNRRAFLEMMKLRVAEAQAERRDGSDDYPACLILLDIDHFKQINDSLGHAAGDTVLIEVAARLRKAVRDTDMILRWGGEEFLVFSPKSNPAQIAGLVERVLYSVGAETICVSERQLQVTLTAGFILLPFSDVDENLFGWQKALQIADMALYLGKANGRNRAYGVTALLQPAAIVLPLLEEDLAAAVAAGMLELVEVAGPMKLDLAQIKSA